MALWLLEAREDVLDSPDNPWGYDCYYGFVVRAETETEARSIKLPHGDEVRRRFGGIGPLNVWEYPEYTTCELINPAGPAEVIQGDFRAG